MTAVKFQVFTCQGCKGTVVITALAFDGEGNIWIRAYCLKCCKTLRTSFRIPDFLSDRFGGGDVPFD